MKVQKIECPQRQEARSQRKRSRSTTRASNTDIGAALVKAPIWFSLGAGPALSQQQPGLAAPQGAAGTGQSATPTLDIPAVSGKSQNQPDFLAHAQKDLRSGKQHRELAALGMLVVTQDPKDRPKDLRDALCALLKSKDTLVPLQAATALAVWGTAEEIPRLEETQKSALGDQNIVFRDACARAIAKLRKG